MARSARQEQIVKKLSINDPPHRIGVALGEVRRGAASPVRAAAHLLPPGIELGQQYDTLGVLTMRFPDGCRMSELAHALRVDASTATRAVDRLVAAKLARRKRAHDDGRAMIVEPTAKGVDLYLAASKVVSPIMRERLNAVLSSDEQIVLANLLERVIGVFDVPADDDGDA